MTPLPIRAVLGLDQASRTGWGIGALVEGLSPTLVRHGVAKTHAERRAVVELALKYAGGDPRQLLVMFECHAGMPLTRLGRHDHTTRRQGRAGAPERSTASILGQGAAKGRWDELLDLVGHPERLRDQVLMTWTPAHVSRCDPGPRCLDVSPHGWRCSRAANVASGYCWQHQPGLPEELVVLRDPRTGAPVEVG